VSGIAVDSSRSPGPSASVLCPTLTERLSALGPVSAYHSWTGEAFGDESRMTYFHLRRADRGFHIDYCFIPNRWRTRIRSISVGEPHVWLGYSDHMPLIVDLDLASVPRSENDSTRQP